MAAPMRAGKLFSFWKFFPRITGNFQIKTCKTYSSSSQTTEDVSYPPIKPMFPPGLWGNITPKRAWELEDERQVLLAKPTAKWRLEHMAGQLPGKIMWFVNSIDTQPKTLPYKQFLTKTHIERELPDLYKTSTGEQDYLLQTLVDRVRSQVEDVILLEEEMFLRERSAVSSGHRQLDRAQGYYRQRICQQIIEVLMNNASYDVPHLLDTQVDSDVTVQSFWQRVGCVDADDKSTKGQYNYGGGRLWFQGTHNFSLQIRSELPLPEIIPTDDPLCSGEVPELRYSPMTYGMAHLKRRAFNSTGHWQEDPCEFSLLSLSVPNFLFDVYIRQFGERFLDEAYTNYGMTAAFVSCVAQAQNQGFNWLMDLTYPFTHQSVVTDGRQFQFVAYQLNTLRLWVNDDVQTLRNICWTTERKPLYETIENGQIQGFNEDVLKMLYKFVIMKPGDRGTDLRPYLPQELAPGKRKDLYINRKGEEPFPFSEKPGQFEYPRNSAYFQQNI